MRWRSRTRKSFQTTFGNGWMARFGKGTFSDLIRRRSFVLRIVCPCPRTFRPKCPRTVSPKQGSVMLNCSRCVVPTRAGCKVDARQKVDGEGLKYDDPSHVRGYGLTTRGHIEAAVACDRQILRKTVALCACPWKSGHRFSSCPRQMRCDESVAHRRDLT